MHLDPRGQARRDLTEAVDAAEQQHREQIEYIIASSDGPYDTPLAGAERACKRERNQAWREYRLQMARIRRAESVAAA